MRIQKIQNLIDSLRGKKKKNSSLLNMSIRQPNSGFFVDAVIYEELRKEIKKIPFYHFNDKTPSSQAEWLKNLSTLKELILTENPNNFLQWEIIRYTMFVTDEFGEYISKELNYLQNSSEWHSRYIVAIRENIVGNPDPCKYYPSSSCNLIHNAYSVAQLEEKTQIKSNDIDLVFEFGGGYGSMGRLFYNLDFNGRYIIFDLQEFSLLQKFYLKTIGFKVLSIDEFKNGKKGILCISDIKELEDILVNLDNSRKNLFLATWSLSEVPDYIRQSIVPLLNNFNLFLIAYQDKFNEMNNIEYFQNFTTNRVDINWMNYPIEHITGSNYLIGAKK